MTISSFLPRQHVKHPSPWDSDTPIREELFSAERLEQHAESLAAAQTVSVTSIKLPSLVRRLRENAAALLDAHQVTAKALDQGYAITPAAEWLVDNYHIVEEQIREIQTDLPSGYYRQLPKLADGPFRGYPRVFGLAWAFIAHTDSHFDQATLLRFVTAYQRVQPLTIGELWAVAITLRIVLVENLRRSAARIILARAGRQEADILADRLLGSNGMTAEPATIVLSPYANAPLPAALAVQLVQRLRDQDPKVTPALEWLETHLSKSNITSDAIVQEEHQRQGASNVTVRNIITSMRLISDVDWAEMVESVSLVDIALRANKDFAEMDFPTRNLYRSAIEELARGSRYAELDIARRAISAAEQASPPLAEVPAGENRRQADPGYYLIAEGRAGFEQLIGYRVPPHLWIPRFAKRMGIGGYVTTTIVAAIILLIVPLAILASYIPDGWMIAALAFLGLVPALDLATALINRDFTTGFGTTSLPAMELLKGIPTHLRTIVVVPTLLTDKATINEQIERLEIHYLTSPTGEVCFALLSDWADAEFEHMPGDQALCDVAIAGLAELNQRYAPGGDKLFFSLHRRRVWNAAQKRWMGWERKRGKLHELNRLLRGATDTTFIDTENQLAGIPADTRYVITLDADTRLPREAVRRLIGKMAHPLNHPRFDPAAGRVVEGYAILQPRVTPSLPVGREGSLFQRIVSSPGGIDPYAAAVSDLYQDLFGEGSYTGKGIYDVDAFESALHGRIPDNTVLSHDLFEGTFARAGLASDIEVVEEFPSRYDVAAARQHRWARGDWQLLPWLLGRRSPGKSRLEDAMPSIGFWKMADNLRRTLAAPATVAALVAGWTLPLHAALVWSLFLLATIAVPTLVPVIVAVIPRRVNITPLSHLRAFGIELRLVLLQIAVQIIFLAHQAWLMSDAILRTMFRLYVSHRNLLEWVTAAQATIGPKLDILGFARQMAGSIIIAIGAGIVTWFAMPSAWPIALPIALLWIASPAVAYWISLSARDAGTLAVSPADGDTLRLIARRTWRYFETFVTADDQMLPPDNFQEDPKPVLAHRTSPTNLGLYLLSAVSAWDFGWAGLRETIDRLSATFDTMERLERFRGHFYNWYDTRTLRPLDPKYISTVDSGNLAGHLIAVANACRAWRTPQTIDSNRLLLGLKDEMELTRDTLQYLSSTNKIARDAVQSVEQPMKTLEAAIATYLSEPGDSAVMLADLVSLTTAVVDGADRLASEQGEEGADLMFWSKAMLRTVSAHLADVGQSVEAPGVVEGQLQKIEEAARRLADDMKFGFLLNRDRGLLSIGYLATEGSLDPSCYDLLASEARLASLYAIAKGDIPTRHWFRLGRTVTPIGAGAALISWSGSMFEYLMPALVMRAPSGSLLEQTSRLVVRRQMRYAAKLGLPWGISESAYNARDLEFTYQYSSFGVPGLGLKRGLGESAVIAPYATALAVMVDPAAATRNFAHLKQIGAQGRYGYYEALDFTPKHLPEGQTVAIVRAFMSHHQGMSIISIANALFDSVMRTRFHAEPVIQASELLLQERMPRDVALERPKAEDIQTASKILDNEPVKLRRFRSPHDLVPATHLLSNGRYAVMITAAGSGYSRWKDLAVTRWREDTTRDDWGSYIFLRNTQNGKIWSAGYQPSGIEADKYRATFSEDRAELVRRDGALTTALEILVSPEEDAEVRRLSISNADSQSLEIEVTSYTELVLATQASDTAHPAFSKLFVETEYLADIGALIATRRRRSPSEAEIWAAQIMVVEGKAIGDLEVETDRSQFLGRGRDLRTPIAMAHQPLSGTVGTVLDPIFSLRRRLRVPARGTVRAAFWTLVASSRQNLLDLIDKHQNANAFQRASTLTWTQAQVQLRHLNIDQDEANIFQGLASHILYANGFLRASDDMIRRGKGPQSGLWQQGISGDTPIVLVRIDDIVDIDVVQQALRAHEYWRMKQISVDLVILNERASSYVQDLQIALETAVRASQSRPSPGEAPGRGSVYVLRTDLISMEMRALLPAVARVILVARRGKLSEQLHRMKLPSAVPAIDSTRTRQSVSRREAPKGSGLPAVAPALTDLEFFNGLGGFSMGGHEYVTQIKEGHRTPAPWINVIANPAFGFQVATEGSGYTWSVNSREHQLTPWSNDPITDPAGEAFYIRDEETGEFWTPTALFGGRDDTAYIARHGHGYSRFEHQSHGISQDLLQFVPRQDPIKISRLTLRNTSGRARKLSVTTYVEWILGSTRGATAPFVVTTLDPQTNALFAQNAWNATFKSSVAFADLAGRQTEWTGDRQEFIGRNGTLREPAALIGETPLTSRLGAGLDPCGVLRAPIELAAGGVVEIVFFLGEAASESDAQALIARYRSTDLDAAFQEVSTYWETVLGTIQVKTPDRSMDLMLNGWMLYQTLACRFWARSAFYQASGAYGFRDQLQDGMALALSQPALTRAHLLRAAGRQFPEGDLQHWWLPPQGQGVRTRISDDRVWLAFAAAHYIGVTGDLAVLEERLPFLDGPALGSGEHDAFFQPMTAEESTSLYEHCALALDHSLAVGVHGLPLMGTGDWNDGMNRVGEAGKGESTWLGWFLHSTLTAFGRLATARGDGAHATTWQAHATALQQALENDGWDGAWYKRGYFDDGSALGSATSTECQIDSIAQSWAVLSGVAPPARAARAMASLEEHLIRPDDKLALLFTPPFDQSLPDPGYIKGYPPGIRENGGQYTHAAAWTVLAFAKLGDGDKAADLFSLLNPINHATTPAETERYKVEPYVVAADVYSVPPHVGHGGWTWYTGSAGWMYRAGIEGILGFQRRGMELFFDPCIPKAWPGFEITFKFQSTTYHITVTNPQSTGSGIVHLTLDDQERPPQPASIPLVDDGKVHQVHLILGTPVTARGATLPAEGTAPDLV